MKKAIGIDLGTTNSVVTFKERDVKIIQINNNEQTRSCVSFRDNDFIVGNKAYKQMRTKPENTVLSVKRLMGGSIQDKMVQKMKSNDYYKFDIQPLKTGTNDSVAISFDKGEFQFTPEQISAEILKYLKSEAEKQIGKISHAVITVPAYFSEKQRNATRRAANLAGLKVQRLLSEPTAAAISYGVENLKENEDLSILVYDFGGGTFDLSLLTMVNGSFSEDGTGGNMWLGGDDIDMALVNFVKKKICTDNNIDDLDKLINGLDKSKRLKFKQVFREEIENLKIKLSKESEYTLLMDGVEDDNGDEIEFDMIITRDDLEKICTPFIEESIESIESLLSSKSYEIDDIDFILLVGGTSKIPLVEKLLCDKYGTDKVKVSDQPMYAVAMGAGILSHRLGDAFEPDTKDTVEIDEIVYSANRNFYFKLEDSYDLIIESQEPLPVEITRTYKTAQHHQKLVQFEIFSDENGEIKVQNELTGFFAITENLPESSDVIVNFTLSENEIFTITAKTEKDRTEQKINLGRGNRDSKTLELLSTQLNDICSGTFSEPQSNHYLSNAQKEILRMNQLNEDEYDSEEWVKIGERLWNLKLETENIKNDIDHDELTKIKAQILVNDYSELIGISDTNRMTRLLAECEHDIIRSQEALNDLGKLTDNYDSLIMLHVVKVNANDTDNELSNTDRNKLLNMYNEIYRCFKNNEKNKGHEILKEALEFIDNKSKKTGKTVRTVLRTI